MVVLDDLSQGHRAAVHPGAVLVEGDLADRALWTARWRSTARRGSCTSPRARWWGSPWSSPFRYLGENVRNGLNLLESAAEHGVRRFILSSTANLFGLPDARPHRRGRSASRPAAPTASPSTSWSGCSTGWTTASGCATPRCATSTPRARRLAGAGGGPRPGDAPDPAGAAGGAGAAGAGDHLRGRLRDAGRHLRARLRPRGRPGAGARCWRCTRWTRGSRTYNLGNGRGFSVREGDRDGARGDRATRSPSWWARGAPAIPRCWWRGAGASAASWGGSPATSDLRAIVESAWRWHVAHPHGYGGR